MSPDADADACASSPDVANTTHAKKLRACTNCARLKIRCRWPPASERGESVDCTRCSRMSIRCRMPEPVPRKKRGKSSRVTELEKKIDGLVNLFQSQQHTPDSQGSLPSTNASTEEGRQLREMLPCMGHTGPALPQDAEASSSMLTPSTHDGNAQCSPEVVDDFHLVPGFSMTAREADEYLDIYRTKMVPHFPFVPIDPSITARQLHGEKRFLFWCIMQAIVPQPASVQKAVDDWIRRHAAAHIVVARERKLELLQGLVVYIALHAWGDIHIHLGMSANGLLQLAIGLVMEMNIYTLAGPLSWVPKSMLKDAWAVISKGRPMETAPQTLEEQRAVLGGYFVASSVALSMRRDTQIQYTAHIAKCYKSIREAGELATDANILAMVSLQHIADRLRVVFPASVLDRADREPLPVFREHYIMVMASLRKEIDNLPKEEPAISKENPLIWCQYMTLMVRLYEPAMSMRGVPPSETPSATEPYCRTEALWSCVQAVQNAATALLAVPGDTYSYLPFTLISNTAFVMMVSIRLLLEDEERDWDPVLARSKLDHAEISRLVADKFEEADNMALAVGQKRRMFEDNTSRWSNYAYRARWMRQWYLSKVSPAPQGPSEGEPAAAVDGEAADTSMMWTADFAMDQAFWEQLMMDTAGQVPFDFGGGSMGGMMRAVDDAVPMAGLMP